MSRSARKATAAAAALAIAALPILLARCADSCSTTHVQNGAPPCHHLAAAAARIAAVPLPCGHDHRATSVTPTAPSTAVIQSLYPMEPLISPTSPPDLRPAFIVSPARAPAILRI